MYFDNKLLLYSLISLLLLLFFTALSYKLNLVDIPNKRKIHKKPIAFTGGIGLGFSYITLSFLYNFSNVGLSYIISISLLISIFGLIDDKFNISLSSKLSLQSLPILMIIFFDNQTLNTLGVYYNISINLNTFSVPITLLSVLFLINSANYFDGTDGSLVCTSMSTFLILFFLIDDVEIKKFIILIVIPMSIFLLFNFSLFGLPKLFLGDSGSWLIGLLISFLLINFANNYFIHPILLAWSISLLIYEFISINYLRLKSKTKIFKASKDHLHHVLFLKSKSILFTNLALMIFNLVLFFIGYSSYLFFNSAISLLFFIIFYLIYFGVRKKFYPLKPI